MNREAAAGMFSPCMRRRPRAAENAMRRPCGTLERGVWAPGTNELSLLWTGLARRTGRSPCSLGPASQAAGRCTLVHANRRKGGRRPCDLGVLTPSRVPMASLPVLAGLLLAALGLAAGQEPKPSYLVLKL